MDQIQISINKFSSEDNTNVLKVDNLSVTRSGKLILKDVNLEINVVNLLDWSDQMVAANLHFY